MKRTIYSDFTSTVAGSTLPVLTTEEIEAIATDVSAAASDNVLTGSEKLRILIPRTYELSALTDTLVAAAAAAGVSFTALSTARTNYQNYLNGLSPAWDDTAASTTVVRTTLDNLLKVYMDAIADIQGKGTVANSLAQLDSTAATALSDIVNDAVLATTEKTSLMLEYNRAMSEWSILDTKAASLGGFSTQKAAAITAKDALITYLNSLTPAWNSPTVNTPIASPSTFRAKWADFYAAVAELDRVIRTNDFAYTTGATKPQDNATIGAPAGTLVAGVLAENIVSGLAAAVVIDTTAPSIPTGLALTSTYTQEPDGTYISTLKATWTASSATDLAGYILALKEGSGNFIEFPVGKGLSEFQIVAKSNVLYTAKIKAYDAQNNHSGFSSNVTHTTAKDTTAPSAPTSLSATSSFKNIFISWVNPSASDLSTIEVYENTTNNSTTAVIIANLNALPSGSGSFTRSGLGTGALRYYWLKAVDTSGNKSVFTSAVSATTIKAAAGELDDAIINSPSLFDATQVKPVKPLASLSTVGHANEDVGIYNGELYRMVSGAWTKSVQAPDITGQVVASQITDGAVSIAKFAAGITPIELLSSLPSVGNFNGRQVFLTTDKKTYRYDSTLGAFTAKTATSDLTGTITETQIDDNSISAPKIQANSVTAGKIAANTITAGQIQAGAIGTTELAADAVTASKIFVGDTSNKIPPLQDLSYWNTTNIGTGSGPYVLVNDSASGFGGSVRYYILSPSGATVSSGASTQYSPVGARLTPVEPGAKYLVSALNYIATGFTGWNTVWVVWYKADGTTATTTSFASGTDYRSSAASSILGSVPFSSTVIAPTDAAFAYIRLITFWSSTLTNAGQGIIAAPVFQRMASGELIVDGAITANKIATNTITANEIDTGAITSNELAANAVIAGKIQAGTIVANDIAANTITTDKLIVAAGNLVANSDFGANFANWRQWSTPSVQSIVSYNTANIRNALRFTYSGPGTAISSTIFAANKAYSDSGASDDGFAVEPGKSYRVAVETLRNAAFIGTLLVNAYFWMADGSYATSPITIFSTTQSGISSASWTKLTGSFTAPVGATRCWLYVVVESWTAGIVNISNLFCNQKSGGDLIVDGSITTNHITVNTINGDRITAGTLNADKIVAGTITGDKFNTGTSLPGTITVGSTGVDIGTVTSKAQNAPTGDVFIDSCDYSTLSQWNTNWNVIDNNGEFSTGTDSTVVGGKYVRFGNNSGNDTVWYYRKGEPIPFDPNCTYEMEVVCRRVTGTGVMYAGFHGLAADKVTSVNALGANSTGNQHYFVMSSTAPSSSWTSYKGYIKGKSATGSGSVCATPFTAGTVNNNVAYVTPLLIINYNAVAGQTDIAFIRIRKMEVADNVNYVSGQTATNVASWSNDPASRVNAQSTTILPGKILINGATTLSDWRNGSDNTKIEGGAVAANTITANKVSVGIRGITIEGLEFEPNRTTVGGSVVANSLAWTSGTISYINDSGTVTTASISAGSQSWSSGTVYIYWIQGGTTLSTTTTVSTANASNNVIIATYKGGVDLVATYGRTIIDGSKITTGTITASKLNVSSLSAITANLGTITAGFMQSPSGNTQIDLNNALITFNNGTYMKVMGVGFGTSNQFLEWYGPTMTVSSCSETNALSYEKTNGECYFGGITPNARSAIGYAVGTVPSSGTFVQMGNVLTVFPSSTALSLRFDNVGATDFGGTGANFSYKWQYSSDGSSWSDVGSAQTGAITAGSTFTAQTTLATSKTGLTANLAAYFRLVINRTSGTGNPSVFGDAKIG